MESSPRIELLSSSELRRLFIESGLADLVEAKSLAETVEFDSHPSQTLAREPFCTRSLILGYANEAGRIVARLHRYLRTDGSLGASGRADPKYLFINSVIYKQAPKSD
jgi:hypothetical protein